MFFGNCTEIRMDAYQCTNYKSNDLEVGFTRVTDSHMKIRNGFSLEKDFIVRQQFNPSLGWMSLRQT